MGVIAGEIRDTCAGAVDPMMHQGARLIGSLPASQLAPKTQIDILIIREEIVVKQADLAQHFGTK
ncbi:hypothetical protein D3C83_213700 [compost metagenome]